MAMPDYASSASDLKVAQDFAAFQRKMMHGCPQHDNSSMNHDRHCSAGDRVSKYYAAGNITFFREQETESLYTAQREATHMRHVDAIGNRSHQP